MTKFQADIYLKSIEYTGETIGREFDIKIKINRETKPLHKKLKPNTVNLFEDLIYTNNIDYILDNVL